MGLSAFNRAREKAAAVKIQEQQVQETAVAKVVSVPKVEKAPTPEPVSPVPEIYEKPVIEEVMEEADKPTAEVSKKEAAQVRTKVASGRTRAAEKNTAVRRR